MTSPFDIFNEAGHRFLETARAHRARAREAEDLSTGVREELAAKRFEDLSEGLFATARALQPGETTPQWRPQEPQPGEILAAA